MVFLSLITSHNELWNKLNIIAVFTSILDESVITFTIDELARLKRNIKFAEGDFPFSICREFNWRIYEYNFVKKFSISLVDIICYCLNLEIIRLLCDWFTFFSWVNFYSTVWERELDLQSANRRHKELGQRTRSLTQLSYISTWFQYFPLALLIFKTCYRRLRQCKQPQNTTC